MIRYRTLEQLDEICNRLARRPDGPLSPAAAAESGRDGRAPESSARREGSREPALPDLGHRGMHGRRGILESRGVPRAKLAANAGLTLEEHRRPGAAQCLVERSASVRFGSKTIKRSQSLCRCRKDSATSLAGGKTGEGASGGGGLTFQGAIQRLIERCRGGVAAHGVDIGDVDHACHGQEGELLELAAGKATVGSSRRLEVLAGVSVSSRPALDRMEAMRPS